MTWDGRPQIRVTRETCAGTGVCAFYASHTFELDETGKVRVLTGDADAADDIRNAAEACPTRSISVGNVG
ncbi:ferredoxin [Streptomyces sp. NPDC058001]|uniref:ferredoxin n=1 Tax=Streptomyces sp. NPDC058001 TaxID=3346300 RepID=UPI0036EDE7BD